MIAGRKVCDGSKNQRYDPSHLPSEYTPPWASSTLKGTVDVASTSEKTLTGGLDSVD
jgi:hypothetical protein